MRRPLDLAEPLPELISHAAPELKRKIRAGLDEIAKDPKLGKSLGEELHGYRSYKIGQWRIIYREQAQVIEVVAIGPRKTIYKKVALEIKHREEGTAA